MDGSILDHNSDSDSGESWTLLEDSPSCADDVPAGSPNHPKEEAVEKDSSDKDDDTDGISIITDSDPENMTPCEHLNYYYNLSDIEDRPLECNLNQNFSAAPNSSNITNNQDESMRCEDDFLNDSTGKLKTYVHKRNKKLSTVLNIIVLGSVITAAGVAIGHMWGVRDDCLVQSTSSVNKILSNLYKLQEENAFLRNKIKELSIANTLQNQQKKFDTDKVTSIKHPRCKKVFEESLNNKDVRSTKCVDIDVESHMMDNEQEFLGDINKLKTFYKQNKSWLDSEIARRLKDEEASVKKMDNLKPIKINKENAGKRAIKDVNLNLQLQQLSKPELEASYLSISNDEENEIGHEKSKEQKVSYADSLKYSTDGKLTHQDEKKVNKRDLDKMNDSRLKDDPHKKTKRELVVSESSISDIEAKKDDRYTGYKHKHDKKKQDRQKPHKKQKRKNKYEQWEMKGGYIKDYDEIPNTPHNNHYVLSSDKNFMSEDYERTNYMKQFYETNENDDTSQLVESVTESVSDKEPATGNKENNDNKLSWQYKMAELRSEARKKLNLELFGEGSVNSARWYFRRMQRREHSRAKGDMTRKKYPKRYMNYKVKN